jgi:hypothetical protein
MPKKAKDNETKLLEQLAEERKKREVAESALADKEAKELKDRDPMSGAGKLCEAYKINQGEALQLGTELRNTADGRQEEQMKPIPKGYQVRKGSNAFYLVRFDNEDVQKCDLLPNCESKYTQEYEYFMKKPATFKVEQDPPKGKVHLCEHHKKILIG